MKFKFHYFSFVLSGIFFLLFFQNCSKTLFNQGSTESELTYVEPNPGQDNIVPNTKSVAAGKIVFRPRCNASVTVDYDSYCRVGVAGGMHVTGA